MLVLSRHAKEKIHIGDSITIEVKRISGNRVSIAVDAPAHVRILRGELHEAGLAALGLNQTENDSDE